MFERRLIVYASVLEVAALVALLAGRTSVSDFLLYLSVHGFAAALLAAGAWGLLPRGFRNPPALSWLLTFSLAFFVPVLGLAGILGGVLAGYFLPSPARHEPFVLVPPPRFNPVPAPAGSGFRQEDLKSLLLSQDASTELRLQGMQAVRGMPTRATGEVLRETLGDQSDDVRLLAYGILDQKEKALTQQIDRALHLLESATPSRRYRLYRHLAELYWELHFQDLAQGAIRDLALRRAFFFSERTLEENHRDGGMWMLRGRIMMNYEHYSSAEQSFDRALKVGLSPARVYPWLSELALWRADYPRVRRLMASIADDNQFTGLRESVRYWSTS